MPGRAIQISVYNSIHNPSAISELRSPLVLFKIDNNRGLTIGQSPRSTEFTDFILCENDLNSESTVFLVSNRSAETWLWFLDPNFLTLDGKFDPIQNGGKERIFQYNRPQGEA